MDPQNLKVVPEIINGRTMLPLRFVAESLGCDVQWDGVTRTITITYQGE
ncbi:copper amine oxidase N-terminal domain-containing protein [Caldisericum sp.]